MARTARVNSISKYARKPSARRKPRVATRKAAAKARKAVRAQPTAEPAAAPAEAPAASTDEWSESDWEEMDAAVDELARAAEQARHAARDAEVRKASRAVTRKETAHVHFEITGNLEPEEMSAADIFAHMFEAANSHELPTDATPHGLFDSVVLSVQDEIRLLCSVGFGTGGGADVEEAERMCIRMNKRIDLAREVCRRMSQSLTRGGR